MASTLDSPDCVGEGGEALRAPALGDVGTDAPRPWAAAVTGWGSAKRTATRPTARIAATSRFVRIESSTWTRNGPGPTTGLPRFVRLVSIF